MNSDKDVSINESDSQEIANIYRHCGNNLGWSVHRPKDERQMDEEIQILAKMIETTPRPYKAIYKYCASMNAIIYNDAKTAEELTDELMTLHKRIATLLKREIKQQTTLVDEGKIKEMYIQCSELNPYYAFDDKSDEEMWNELTNLCTSLESVLFQT
jgi:chaperonin cofactor prefoldin